MEVLLTPTAQAQLDHQLTVSVRLFGKAVAAKTLGRIERSLRLLSEFPASGRWREERNLYETAIPRTPFVLVYRIEERAGIVRILGVFHAGQDRSDFEAG